ncbi:MAG: hypothetical protein L0332_20800 [Chloroflexi bacterium]|nr:hypothetical protein [Chloroflexota bacterium]MCI0577214.1 hypothetical protein [Chloroflexota bacterium]MCI0645913.1 hypothetical protein [Chloroflexota bacterium]MCI0729137.1 hypothetical protein [Chloroflexota bacterium]
MAKKRKDPLLDALAEGRPFEITLPEDGDLASMRAALKHGQVLTLSPVTDFCEVQTGDIVFVRWRNGSHILHLVKEIQGDQFLIANSLGKINGWAHGRDILGRVTKIIDPPPRPAVPEMLDLLQAAYHKLVEREQPGEDDIRRLYAVAGDMRWYAERLGPDRWERLPRQNKASFRWHLWHITRQAVEAAGAPSPEPVQYFVDHGKEHVGQVAEIIALFGLNR